MKKIIALLATVTLLSVSCQEAQTDPEPSLTITPAELSFDAEGATPQTVEITAVGLEWEHEVPAGIADWVTVARDGNILTFSVTDNKKGDQLTAIVPIKVLNNADMRDRSVTIIQKGNDNPVEYSLTLNPVYLEFAGTDAPARDITVTATGGMTWSADKGTADWITITPGEGKLTVAVSDNESEDSREGTITVTPGEDGVEPETVRVVQQGFVNFSVDESELAFSFYNATSNQKKIAVEAANVAWEAKAVDDEGNEASWLALYPTATYVNVIAANNTEQQERQAWVVFTTDWEEKSEVRVRVTQEAAKEFHSTLTGDVDLTGKITVVEAEVNPWQIWENDTPAQNTNAWIIYMYDGNLDHSFGDTFSGQGSVLKLTIATDRVEFNKENVYHIAETTYTVTEAPSKATDRVAGTVYAGKLSTSPFNKYPNSYYIEFDGENIVSNSAPIADGTVTVSRNGEEYTFDIKLTDDFGWNITGTYTGKIDLSVQGSMTEDPDAGK